MPLSPENSSKHSEIEIEIPSSSTDGIINFKNKVVVDGVSIQK